MPVASRTRHASTWHIMAPHCCVVGRHFFQRNSVSRCHLQRQFLCHFCLHTSGHPGRVATCGYQVNRFLRGRKKSNCCWKTLQHIRLPTQKLRCGNCIVIEDLFSQPMICVHRQGLPRLRFFERIKMCTQSVNTTRWYIQVQHVVYVDLETAFTVRRFNYLISVDLLISAGQRIFLQEHIRAVLDNLEAWSISKERKEAEFRVQRTYKGHWKSQRFFIIMAPGFFRWSLWSSVFFTGFERPSSDWYAVPVRISAHAAHMSTRTHKKRPKMVCQQASEYCQNLCPNEELPFHI